MERQKTPTLINLPPPDPYTPSDLPGTPNSAQTSLSAVSTTAIKDGQHGPGHRHHHHHHHSSSNVSNSSTNTLDAERADRISRLAGLERVSTVRQPSNNNNLQAGAAAAAFNPAGTNVSNAQHVSGQLQPQHQTVGYFDASGNPRLAVARSTVGSASATGSIGGRTTWASGSTTTENDHEQEQEAAYDQDADGRSMSHMSMQDTNLSAAGDDPDKMSDVDAISSAGLSDGGQESLVGFGEGANSTVSGPTSAPRDPIQMARLRAAARMGMGSTASAPGSSGSMGMAGVERTGLSGQNGFGGSLNPGVPAASPDTSMGMEGVETAERIVQERLGQPEGGMQSPTDGRLGKFSFEGR